MIVSCKYCKSSLHQDAVICPQCGAEKGWVDTKYGVGGPGTLIFMLVVSLIPITVHAAFWFYGNDEIANLLFVLSAPALIWLVAAIYCLFKGPRWFKPNRHVVTPQ